VTEKCTHPYAVTAVLAFLAK